MRKISRDAIDRLLESNGLSQAKLAQLADIDPKTLSSVLKGNPYRPDTLARIAEALDVRPAQLLEGQHCSDVPGERRFVIQLVLEIPFEQVETTEGLSHLLNTISTVINSKGKINVVGMESGSVIITLSMCQEDLESLIRVMSRGKLEHLRSYNVLDEDRLLSLFPLSNRFFLTKEEEQEYNRKRLQRSSENRKKRREDKKKDNKKNRKKQPDQ